MKMKIGCKSVYTGEDRANDALQTTIHKEIFIRRQSLYGSEVFLVLLKYCLKGENFL